MNYQRFFEFKVIFLIPVAIVLFGSLSLYGMVGSQPGPDNQPVEIKYINISSPLPNQNVTIGNLTVTGSSSDNSSSNCTVYVGWNDSRPFQKAVPNGSRGVDDYSKWNFTFDPTYHEIVNGTNLINSELSCFEVFPHSVTSNALNATYPLNATYALNVTGVINTNGSNVTDAGYFYPGNSSDGYYGTDSSQGSTLDPLAYDNSSNSGGGDYNFDSSSTDSGNSDNSGSTDSSGSSNNDDSSADNGSTDGTGTGSVGTRDNGTYPYIDDGVFDIGAAGDWASGNSAHETALSMYQKGVDLTLGLGDYAYSTGSSAVHAWWDNWMAPVHDRFKGALGNHDTQDQSTYAQLFGQSNGWYYSFDKQGVHFVAMNTEETFGPGSSQYKFIDQDLQSAASKSDVKWIIVFFHEPMYTSPSHHAPLSALRNAYHPLFDKYGVDLVLQGHNHNYQRSFPISYNSKDPSKPIVTSSENADYNDPLGQIYTEVGTGGQDSYSLDGRSLFISQQLTTTGGFLDVAFPNGQTMKGTFYDNSGSVKDEFTIHKSGTTPASNATKLKSNAINSTNVLTTNATEAGFDIPNENSSKVNLNISDISDIPDIVTPVPTPSGDNQSGILNNTEGDNPVVSNDSQSNTTKEIVDPTYGEGTSASQDSHNSNTNTTLPVDTEITSDAIRNKVTKIASEMAKGALHEAEQTLNDDKNVGTNNIGLDPHTTTTTPATASNLPEKTYVSKYSDQSVNQGRDQRLPGTIDEHRASIKYKLAQEADKEIDSAWKGLENKFGNNVTKIEAADKLKPKSDSSPSTSDASQKSSSLRSLHVGLTESNSKIDNLATENQRHHKSTSHSGTSNDHLASSAIISKDSQLGRKIDLKADAGQNQVVIEGNAVTLDGTKSKIGENSGLSYMWKQVGGPKVRIVGSNSPIASFEAPKVSLAKDKLTLKFVLLITDESDGTGHNNNDKDGITVVVKHDPSLSQKAELSSSTYNKDRSSSPAANKIQSNNDPIVDNSHGTINDADGRSEQTNNEERTPQPDNVAPPIETTQADANNSNTPSG
jgi:hypothetical protein